MTDEELRNTVSRILGDIAPDIDIAKLEPDVAYRDQFDFDSMDFLNFAIALHKEFKIDIPETEYPQLSTLDGAVAYLKSRQIVA